MDNVIPISKWIWFDKQPKSNLDAKTDVFYIKTIDNNVHLGEIKWMGSWRKYSFFPAPKTVFETTCIMDIINFINYLMNERKNNGKDSNNTKAQNGQSQLGKQEDGLD